MGSRFDITVVTTNQSEGDLFINTAIAEIERIEKLISSWDSNSQISRVNRSAGIKPESVDKEVFELVKRAKHISKISDGAFDISYASIDKVWKFDGSMVELPSESDIKRSVENINYQNIILDESNYSIFLKNSGMKIGFGAIGKGYAADMAKKLLLSMGVKNGIINASGDLNTWGVKPDGKDWTVGITNPLNKENTFSWVPLKNKAVATSGTYEKRVTFKGINYSHIIDPRTGWPIANIISVSVFSPSAELSDALATTVFVLGVGSGLNLINQLKDTHCIIIDASNAIHKSDKLKTNEELL
tara:strand:+ start:2971 stop:3873 length:903 start_codon:yes stop_codon:yes gene_type:complete